MADKEEQDRRFFALAVKSDDPFKLYSEIRDEVEEAMTPKPDIEDEPQEVADWLRKR